jgi:16S rRNA (uracil1498-N3)-methyltransferase
MRIFVAPLAAGELTVRGDEHHYLSRVRRARVGDTLELVDGEGLRAQATIVAIGPDATQLRVDALQAVPDELPTIRALIPVIKGDRMDVCVEKLVEVGVDEIVVWPASRSVVKLDVTRRVSRLEHYKALAQAAARQSGRASVPLVEMAESLAAAIGRLPAGRHLVLDPGVDQSLLDVMTSPAGGRPASAHASISVPVAILTGPEGGLAGFELEMATGAGFTPVGLGPRVLRAETAPVIAVALVRAASKS